MLILVLWERSREIFLPRHENLPKAKIRTQNLFLSIPYLFLYWTPFNKSRCTVNAENPLYTYICIYFFLRGKTHEHLYSRKVLLLNNFCSTHLCFLGWELAEGLGRHYESFPLCDSTLSLLSISHPWSHHKHSSAFCLQSTILPSLFFWRGIGLGAMVNPFSVLPFLT